MKDLGIIKSKEKIDEVPMKEGNGTKLVAKHYIQYVIPKKRFDEKMKVLYNDLFKESYNPQVFSDSSTLINDVIDMDDDNAYKNRGGLNKEVVSEDGGATSCGSVMQGGGGNPDARSIYCTFW